MNIKRYYIYGLFDPREPEVFRYVGKTSAPAHRLSTHRVQPANNWVKHLKSQGIRVEMTVIEACHESAIKGQGNILD